MNTRCAEFARVLKALEIEGNRLATDMQLASINGRNAKPDEVSFKSLRPLLGEVGNLIGKLQGEYLALEKQVKQEAGSN